MALKACVSSAARVTGLHMGPFSLRKRPDVLNPRPWVTGALAAGAAALAVRRLRRPR